MTTDEIKQIIIREILEVAPEINEGDIDPDAHIQRSLEIDSFDFLRILTALNNAIGVEVPEADYGQVDTLNHMADYFVKHLEKR
ncbi:MAG TPA: acyl carrier protein [Epsilonproteobacteria bacterium]|nr:acyl carrier protein [Campylobacterota bacterium]